MAKVLHCAEVDPSSRCPYVARGATEEELLQDVQRHATEHGIREVTPELLARVKSLIKSE